VHQVNSIFKWTTTTSLQILTPHRVDWCRIQNCIRGEPSSNLSRFTCRFLPEPYPCFVYYLSISFDAA